jgi:hypothetical protein
MSILIKYLLTRSDIGISLKKSFSSFGRILRQYNYVLDILCLYLEAIFLVIAQGNFIQNFISAKVISFT